VMTHVRVPPRQNVVPTESHSDGQLAGYLLRTLWTLLSSLGYEEPPHFIRTPRLFRGNVYLWHIRVVIYERSMTDHIHHICQVIEAFAPRWTFEGGMRDVARKALVILRHEDDDQIEHSQYCHFPSHAREGAEVMVLPTEGHDRKGCFVD
jgi:hypothetical protein